jgi:F-type H+-transporting ATPase subunit delta
VTPGGAVARRYAKALFPLAAEGHQADAVTEELGRVERLLQGDATLREAIARPWVKASDQRALVLAVADSLRLSPLTRSFLTLLAQRRRLPLLGAVLAAYRQLTDEAAGRLRARVRSAAPLSNAERTAVRERLGRRLGKAVLLETEVDPALLGGFVAEVGGLVLDASLKGQLVALRERITKGASA